MPFTFKTTAEEAATELKDHIVGKNVLVTGVSPKSLGTETVRVLAPYAKTLILASRSKERVADAVKDIVEAYPSANIKIVALDLGSGESIRAAAAEILALDIPINVVINNAAVAQCTSVVRTKEGFESQFGSNHLGHFLLVSLLKPVILRAATPAYPSRIVNVSSIAANYGGEIRWDDPNYNLRPEEFSMYPSYAQSKMGNILFSLALAKKYGSQGIQSYSLHPGVIRNTNMGSVAPLSDFVKFGLANEDGTGKEENTFKTIETGTSTQIIAAFDPSIASQNGAFLDDGVPHNDRMLPFGSNQENADRLWELSEKSWGITF